MQSDRAKTMEGPRDQAYWLLRAGFTAAPMLAGFDKFTEKMVRWEDYLSPTFAKLAPVSPRTFMKLVGVVELAAGTMVALKPKVGSYVVAAWLGGIMTNLLLHPRRYLDIALRDLGLALGALALGRLEADRAQASRMLPTQRPLRSGAEPAVPMPQRLWPTLEEPQHAH